MSLPIALDTNALVRLLTNDDPLQALDADVRGLDFVDALHLLRSEGCAALASFDRALVRRSAELALSPPVQEL